MRVGAGCERIEELPTLRGCDRVGIRTLVRGDGRAIGGWWKRRIGTDRERLSPQLGAELVRRVGRR